MHWIHWKLARESAAIPARLVRIEDEDLILATDDDQELRWWNHDLARVMEHAESEACRVVLYPDKYAMRIGNAWFNCSRTATHTPCIRED
jgi:hypothetical protein